MWTGSFVVMLGVVLLAMAAYNMARQPDKRTSGYQLGVAAVFCGMVFVLCGLLMAESGLGTRLFTGGGGRMGMGGF